MQEKLNKFKNIVIQNSENPDFDYREWFVKDHLLIMERIAMELCDIYTDADRDVVFALVWFHDFGKPLDHKNEREVTCTTGVEALREVGLDEDFVQKVLGFWTLMEQKNEIDISKQAIEVQIASTADGCSHLTGKFLSTYFSNMPKESIEKIEHDTREKIKRDWERKITLPEAREAFKLRYERAKEITGEYPEKFI